MDGTRKRSDDFPRRVHLVGVGGTGMAATAALFKDAGCDVRGSDQAPPYPPMGPLLDSLGIPVAYPYSRTNLEWGPDLVVIGNVVRATNPEAVAAMDSGLRFTSMPDALYDFFLAGRSPLVVAGTHGKTTTASLAAHLLSAQGLEPGMLVGGVPRGLGRNSRIGGGEFFVVEGDEYDTAFFDKTPKFLHYAPAAAVINNIEFDHADIYENMQAVLDAFKRFASIVEPGSVLLVPDGDRWCLEAASASRARVRTFGIGRGDWSARPSSRHGGVFELFRDGRSMGRFRTPLVGDHNLMNSVAALALVHEIGAETEGLDTALASFEGVARRFEVVGTRGGVTVIDDFAHHPTAVRETLRAARDRFPGARIVALFEPESNTSRRKVFQQDYVAAFSLADHVLFAPVLRKPDGLRPDEMLDLGALCAELDLRGTHALLVEGLQEMAREAARLAGRGDVILVMSGRDFGGVQRMVIDALDSGVHGP